MVDRTDGCPRRTLRASVEHLIGLMAEGWSEAEILTDHPGLAPEDLSACLAYACNDSGFNLHRRPSG
jgi:uncharacterized protein (DUF433 family)